MTKVRLGLGSDCVDMGLQFIDNIDRHPERVTKYNKYVHPQLYIRPRFLDFLRGIQNYGYREPVPGQFATDKQQVEFYVEYVSRCQVMGTHYQPQFRSGKCILGRKHKGDHDLELINSYRFTG